MRLMHIDTLTENGSIRAKEVECCVQGTNMENLALCFSVCKMRMRIDFKNSKNIAWCLTVYLHSIQGIVDFCSQMMFLEFRCKLDSQRQECQE